MIHEYQDNPSPEIVAKIIKRVDNYIIRCIVTLCKYNNYADIMEDQDIYDTAVVGVIESLPTFPRDESSTLILPRMKAYIVSHLRKEGRKYASIVLGNTDMHVYDIYNMETNLSVADSPAIKAIDASLDVGEVTSKMAQSGELNPEELRLLHEKFVLDKSVRQIALESDYNYDTLWHTFDDIYAKYKKYL